MDETKAIATVRASGGLAIHTGPTVLGERQVRLPTAGKIRPGIKVLTATAAKNPQAQAIYKAGMAAGKPFGAMEAEIRAACDVKWPLTPKNTAYFTVRPCDFAVPEMAARIMDLYAEDRGEGLHLYRLPVMFAIDSWQAVLPHALKAWSRSELLYWSEYGPNEKRYCKQFAAVPIDPKSKRAHRSFGGRRTTLRAENEGVCDPDKCAEYQAGACKLNGALIFYVPGITGAGAIELPMSSFYALQGMRQQLELMLYMRGRLRGFEFLLTKQQKEVSMIDLETGKPKRVKQWISVLEAPIDVTKLLTAAEGEGDEAEEHAVESAVAVLEGRGEIIEEEEEEEDDQEADEKDDDKDDEEERREGNHEVTPTVILTIPSGAPTMAELQARIKTRMHDLALTFRECAPHWVRMWGDKWSTDTEALAAIVDGLEAVENAEDYRSMLEVPF